MKPKTSFRFVSAWLRAFGLLLVCGSGLAAAVFDSTEWEFRQDIDVPSARVMKLALPSALLGASQGGLVDLRLTDPDGNSVPFLVQHPVARRAGMIAPKTMQVSLDANRTVVSISTGTKSPIDGVVIQAGARRYLKSLLVEGSSDGASWTLLRRGAPIFEEPAGPSQRLVEFEAGEWAYLRLTLDDRRTPAVPITGVVLREASSEPAPKEIIAGAVLDRSESSVESRVVIDLGAANLPVESLEIETTEPLFRRQVVALQREVVGEEVREVGIGSGTVFRVQLDDAASATNLFVPIGRSVGSREVVLTFANGDSPALKITGVRVHVRPSHVVFGATKAGRHSFWTGNRVAKAPVYDVAGLSASVRGLAATKVEWMPVSRNPTFKLPDSLRLVEVLGGVIEPKLWTVRRPITIAGAGISQLELDLAASSGAQSGMVDIRLFNSGRQVPFLVDRTSLTRPVPVEFTAAADSKRPTVGRWTIGLPFKGAPIADLVATSPSPLFDRTFRLFEIGTTSRGEPVKQLLQEKRWVRTPDQTATRLVFDLNRRIGSRELVLETDNGDNPAIELSGLTANRPVARVVFKAPTSGPTELLYGNATAGAPRYDLGLLAREVLSAPRQVASLADEIAAEKANRFSWGAATWAFWVVLALVVVGLLAVMTKLLPKPGGG